MNYTKKICKICIPILLVLFFLALSIFVFTFKRQKEIKVLNIPTDYFLSNQSNELIIYAPIFINQFDSVYMDKELISRSYIQSVDESIVFTVNMKDITYDKESVYNDETFYMYDFSIEIPFELNTTLTINNLYLKLEYSFEENILIKLGSLCLYNEIENTDIAYSSLKGYFTKNNNIPVLEAVLVKLYSEDEYVITNIDAISPYCTVDKTYSKKINYINENETPLNSFIVERSFNSNIINTNIKMDGIDYLLIYLNNSYIKNSSTIGFIIEYEKENKTYQKIINPFKFFDSSLNTDIEIQTYDFSKNK